MKLQIVDFETAKYLKELGFDWKDTVSKYYDTKGNRILYLHGIPDEKYGYILRPEQSLVVKWLRDVHKLKITVYPKRFFEDLYCLSISINNEIIHSPKHFYKIYEEAELDGIREAIKYLKNGRNKNNIQSS